MAPSVLALFIGGLIIGIEKVTHHLGLSQLIALRYIIVISESHPFKILITEICEKRDSQGLEDWRGFYKRRLLELDRESVKTVCCK